MAAPKSKPVPPDPSRLVAPQLREEDELESSLRPKRLAEFVGQAQARENLSVFVSAAKGRGEDRWIMCCSRGRQASARRRWPRS